MDAGIKAINRSRFQPQTRLRRFIVERNKRMNLRISEETESILRSAKKHREEQTNTPAKINHMMDEAVLAIFGDAAPPFTPSQKRKRGIQAVPLTARFGVALSTPARVALQRAAEKHELPISELVDEALALYFAPKRKPRKTA